MQQIDLHYKKFYYIINLNKYFQGVILNTKTLKGILLYSLILIGSALAVFAAIIIIMFIFPNLKLFGYGMISKKQTLTNSTSISTADASSEFDIVVSANNFDVIITCSSDESISYTLFNNCLGASNIANATANEELTENSYSLNITEPSGVVFYRDSYLKINVPSGLTYNLTAKSGSGNISVSNLNLNNLKIKTGSGNFYISTAEQTNLELNNVDISTNSGNFDFKSKYENVKITNGLTFNANKGDITFKNLESDVELVGKDIYFEANTLKTSQNGFEANVSNIVLKIFHLNSPGGSSQNSILASSCLININELTGTSSIKSSNGTITIGTTNSPTIIYSSDGNVNVTTAKENIKIDCEYSDITLTEYEESAYIKSLSGNISAKSTSEDYTNNSTKIITSSGSITHETNGVPFEIISKGNSDISVTINKFSYDKDTIKFGNDDKASYLIDAPNSSVKVKYSAGYYFKYLIAKNTIIENSINFKSYTTPTISPSETNLVVDSSRETSIEEGVFNNQDDKNNFIKNNLSLLKIIAYKLTIASIYIAP